MKFLTNFREVNKSIQQKPLPLPRIIESLQKKGCKSATVVEVSQEYWNISLSKNSEIVFTMILPWGKYAYKRLDIGITSDPDIFQLIIIDLVENLDCILVYTDNILGLKREEKWKGDYLKKV